MSDSAIAKGNTQNLINQFEGRNIDQPAEDQPAADQPEADQSEADQSEADQPPEDQPPEQEEATIEVQVKENKDKLDEIFKVIQNATNAAASKQGGLQKQIEANNPIITAVVNVMEVAGKTMVKKYFDVVFGLLGSFFSSYNSTKGEGNYTKAQQLELSLQDPNVKKSVQLVGKTLGEIFGSFLETSGEQILIQGPKLTEAAYTLPNKVARNILFALADAAVAVASTLPIIGTIISGGKIFQRIVMSGTTIFINFLGALVGVSEMFVSFSGSDKTKSGMGDLITNVKSALEAIKGGGEQAAAENIEGLALVIENAAASEEGGEGKEGGEGEEGEGNKNKRKEAELVEAVSQSETLEQKLNAVLSKISNLIDSGGKNDPKEKKQVQEELIQLQKSAEGITDMGGKIKETPKQILEISKDMLNALKTTADNVLIKQLVTAQNKLKTSAKNIAKETKKTVEDAAKKGFGKVSKFFGGKEPDGIERQYEKLSDEITELKINKGILSKTKRGILGGPYVFEATEIKEMIPDIKQDEISDKKIRKKKIKDLEREIKLKKTQKKQMTPKYKKARKSRKKRQKKIRALTSPFRMAKKGLNITAKLITGGQKNKTIKKRNIKRHSKHSNQLNQTKRQNRRKLVIEK
jgi:hypothetical protein